MGRRHPTPTANPSDRCAPGSEGAHSRCSHGFRGRRKREKPYVPRAKHEFSLTDKCESTTAEKPSPEGRRGGRKRGADARTEPLRDTRVTVSPT